MGLILVETIYRIEEEFEITIPDAASEKMATVRAIVDYLMRRPEVSQKWSRDYVLLSVWMILENEAAIDREDWNEDSRLVEDMGLD